MSGTVLLGVVIGALGSYLALVRSDQARFRREEAARWEERRLAVYSDYARSVKKTVTSAVGRDSVARPAAMVMESEAVAVAARSTHR